MFTSTGQGLLGNNMFAYCNNNPVNGLDATGHSVTYSFLDPNPLREMLQCGDGGGAVANALGYIAGAVATVIIAVAVSPTTDTHITTTKPALQIQKKKEIQVEAYVDYNVKRESEYQYWEAYRVANTVVVGRGLTFLEASLHVACGFDIMCANDGAARWLLVVNGYRNAVGPEIHGTEGYYWHYHPNRQSHTHIWFYEWGQ